MMSPAVSNQDRAERTIRFGPFELSPRSGELRRAGVRIKLQEQPFKVLTALLERPGEIVTREELQRRIWPTDNFGDFDHALNVAVAKLRTALCDSAESPHLIETLHRRGYRFIALTHGTAGGSKSPESAPEVREVGDGETGFLEAKVSQPPRPEAAPLEISRAKTGVAARRLLITSASCVVLAFAAVLARPLVPPPRVTGIHQITHIGTVVSNQNLLVSGSRIYFMVGEKGESQIRYVSLDDGSIFPVAKPFPRMELDDIFPSGNELLLGEIAQGVPLTEWRRNLWRWPVPSGTPRRIGNIFADDAAWSPDGRTIVYANESDQSLDLVDADGSNPRKLASLPGRPFRPRWSPDGRLIRTSVFDPKAGGISLWQLDASGRNVTRTLPGWSSPSRAWAGRWTGDGRYFLFAGLQGDRRNIWALRDKKDVLRRSRTEPAQLTDGPLNFYLPVSSDDSKTIYAVGTEVHGQLVRYDTRSRQFEPYANGLSADHIAFSRDAKWMAYVTYPEGALVRSRVDGSERLQLTFAPMHAFVPQWSPDGSQIAFAANVSRGAAQKVYLVSANGGSPRLVVSGPDGEQGQPNWSPDGQSLVFARSDASVSEWAVHSLNLKAGKDAVLPGTLGISSGIVSPDGRYLAFISASTHSLALHDMTSGTTRQLAELGDYPNWSSDSKYVYYSTLMHGAVLPPEQIGIYRVRISDGKIDRLAAAPSFPLAGNWGWWSGLAPDGSILLLRELGTSDIYALDVDLP